MWGYIGMPEYAALVTMLTLGILYLNWVWIKSILPSTKFKELEPLLDELDKGRPEWLHKKDYKNHLALLFEVRRRLTDLKIISPNSKGDKKWDWYLPLILSCSRMGDLKLARKLSKEYINDLEDTKE